MSNRQCGECRMCCKYMYVAEKGTRGGKPYEFIQYPGSWCKHVDMKKGCKVHHTAEQPYSCRSFACAWLMGLGSDADRPDKNKIIVSFEVRTHWSDVDRPQDTQETAMAIVYDCAPGAGGEERAQPMLAVLSDLMAEGRVDGVEFVPFNKPFDDRNFVTREHGPGTIKLHGWPAPLDVDQEYADIREMFDNDIPAHATMLEMYDALESMTAERRAQIRASVEQARARRRLR